VPAELSATLNNTAREMAISLLNALDYVGVLAVEIFVCGDRLLINELAPRVHNSGHWTQDACLTGQFEQHIRAIAGWPLGDPVRAHDAVMTNLLGHEIEGVADNKDPLGKLHLYGKNTARAGRKMGHINRIFPLGKRPDTEDYSL
jgi:5-(carboxyamino)imidazole ribonucleotide synthase